MLKKSRSLVKYKRNFLIISSNQQQNEVLQEVIRADHRRVQIAMDIVRVRLYKTDKSRPRSVKAVLLTIMWIKRVPRPISLGNILLNKVKQISLLLLLSF